MKKAEEWEHLYDFLEKMSSKYRWVMRSDCDKLLDDINDSLADTPFCVLLTGYGHLTPFLKEQIKKQAEFMFDKPYKDYSL